jgi:Zn-dependent peptidase ImmA (M78 family)
MWPVLALLARDYDWNQRVLTTDDFDALCELEDVTVEEAETGFPGLYTRKEGRPIITISPLVLPRARGWVLWHEMGHVLLHDPACGFMYLSAGKLERQADLIAACALIPRPLLENSSLWEIHEEYRYPIELCELRQRFYQELAI